MKPYLLGVNQTHEVFVAILAGTILFLLFALFITAYIIIYWKRKIKYIQEVEKMKRDFNEEILKSQLEMQEQTLNTISQEIHDNVGQILSLAKVQLNIIDQTATNNKNEITEVKENITKAMTDLRDIAKSLSSDRIQQVDLPELLEQELNRISRTGLIHTSMKVEGKMGNLPQQKKMILFRIVQESLQNTIKHADATTVQVALNSSEQEIKLTVCDNGKGFDTNQINNNGLGLQNILNRTRLIGGKASIKSDIGEGTMMILVVPCV